MPVNWKDPKAYERLVASLVASHENLKLDYRKMATMYGEGATYDAIEGRFRHIRRQAAEMVKEVNSGARPQAPARGSGNMVASNSFGMDSNGDVKIPKKIKQSRTSGTCTPRLKVTSNAAEKVLNGRINKNGVSPSRSNSTFRLMKEEIESADMSGMDESMEFDVEGVAQSLGYNGDIGEYGVEV